MAPEGSPLEPGSEALLERGLPTLEVKDLVKRFTVRGTARGQRVRSVVAVDGVSLALYEGEIAALVGESGSGKSTVARVLAQLETPTAGEVVLRGRKVDFGVFGKRRSYLKEVQLVFQDPFSSLNTAHTVRYHLERPLKIHGYESSLKSVGDAVLELLEEVNLSPASRFIDKYPHELSGGQRQRVAIARSLGVRPNVLLADEPVSMLDVSIRLGVLNLLQQLVLERQLALLYITHDIASARYFAETVHVMYSGQIIESGPAEMVTQSPSHPYTQLLIDSSPDPMRQDSLHTSDEGSAALRAPVDVGCRFAPRCPFAMDRCRLEVPPKIVVSGRHWASCWLRVRR